MNGILLLASASLDCWAELLAAHIHRGWDVTGLWSGALCFSVAAAKPSWVYEQGALGLGPVPGAQPYGMPFLLWTTGMLTCWVPMEDNQKIAASEAQTDFEEYRML